MIKEFAQEKENIKISLIVVSVKDDLKDLNILLNSLGSNMEHITEIICVISNVDNKKIIKETLKIDSGIKDKINIVSLKRNLFPGAARNYGIKLSKHKYIAFLDTKTLPNQNWLENAKKLLCQNDFVGFLGKTIYKPKSRFDICFIASTFGLKPITTLPGSLLSNEFIKKVGFFIPHIRASEDKEWINRAKNFSSNLENSETLPLVYEDIQNRNFYQLMKKWYYYYDQISCEKLYIYNMQRFIYIAYFFLVISLSILSLVSFFDQSLIFIAVQDYSTNLSLLITLISLYFILRCILLPIKKGFNIFKNSFLDLLRIVFISISIDFVKTFVFIKSTIRSYFGKTSQNIN